MSEQVKKLSVMILDDDDVEGELQRNERKVKPLKLLIASWESGFTKIDELPLPANKTRQAADSQRRTIYRN